MSYLRMWFLLFLSSIFITPHVDAQGTFPGRSQLTAEQLKLKVDKPWQEIRELKSNAMTSAAAVPGEGLNVFGPHPVGEPFANEPESSVGAVSSVKTVTSVDTVLTPAVDQETSVADFAWLTGNPRAFTPAGAPCSFMPGWTPDLRRCEQRTAAAILVKTLANHR